MNDILAIGIAGPSGSGKSQFAKNLVKNFSNEDILIIQEDAYYIDLSHLSIDLRKIKNFDHLIEIYDEHKDEKDDIKSQDDELFTNVLHLENGKRLVLLMDISKIVVLKD